jgi:hypothetical protein
MGGGGIVVCPSGQTRCGANCTNVTVDNANCGACGVVCSADTPWCDAGQCSGAATCTFDGLVDAGAVSTYTESGITVVATAGSWQSWGQAIAFIASPDVATTAQVRVTAGGSAFRFVSVDLYSSITTIPYVFTGLMGSTTVFSVSGTVPNTFGAFATVPNPYAEDRIDTLTIELTNPPSNNPMGLDNVRLST